ncbi:5'-3' exonuclease [Buchnera aphidicola]|uniref:5'-3' exonuclease n=1 Tax=Buchnera aphidicola TaxID=9 RepID=UPI003BEF2ED5
MLYIKKKPILIIDGSLYLYRAYYAFPQYIDTTGNPTGAIYGMLKMLYTLLKKYNHTSNMIIIFDESKKTFRTTLFPDYKKNRPHMPKLLSIQIQPLIKKIKKIGIKTLSIPGIEADDIIGSLSHKLENAGEKVLIVSHDKDMLQLVTDNIYVLQKINYPIIKPDYIQKEYGINPKEFIDLLALMGDSSDNIPGVPKIGKKTALSLLHTFNNLENIYKNIEKIENLPIRNIKNIIQELKKNKKIAFLSYKLAKIQIHLDIQITIKDMIINHYYKKNFFYFFKKFYLENK